jgi:two-component system chemotaxis response regulator CheY
MPNTATDVLIVDDSGVVRKFTRNLLTELGFTQVREAVDGQNALDTVMESMPELILLDWNMPIMNGLEFLVNLRQLSNGGDPIVIFCTTVNEIGKIQEAVMASANEYIMKPFDRDILRDKLIQVGVMQDDA